MQYSELLTIAPALRNYAETVPQAMAFHFTLGRFAPHSIIHPKDSQLQRIGILLEGTFRVLNEFENGNVFMIETNTPISFVGEVTLLAEADQTSVTIETVTECLIAFLPVEEFDAWLHADSRFLRKVSEHVAKKLYCTSYHSGERFYYSSNYLLLKYIMGLAQPSMSCSQDHVSLRKTRLDISEELGMTVKTINRTLATLRSDGLVSVRQGKLYLTRQQYDEAEKRLSFYMQQSKNGSSSLPANAHP